jgi:hypothetical protein
MSNTFRSPSEGTTTINIPLFQITLPSTSTSHEIFKLRSRCHITLTVEAYKAQTGLMQCYNWQSFGHVWANCKQPPRCTRMCCGNGHLHKECPEKSNTASIRTCCNCKLVDGEEPRPSNYQGCRQAKEETRRRKSRRAPKATTGRVLSSSHTSSGLSFAAVLHSSTEQ